MGGAALRLPRSLEAFNSALLSPRPMRKFWLIAIALWSGLMLLGWIVWASRIERTLESAAGEVLRSHPDARHLKKVSVVFHGQEAVLTGSVPRAALRGLAGKLVGEELRRASGVGATLNPVTSVRNEIAIEPLPLGWMMLVLDGPRITLVGLAGSEEERDAVKRSVENLIVKPGLEFHADVRVDDEAVGETENIDVTLSSLPAKLRAAGSRVSVLTAILGMEWQVHQPDAQGKLHEQSLANGVTEKDWDLRLLPVVKRAQMSRAIEREKAEAEDRAAQLPPPHVILAARGGDVLIEGEVGTATLKTQLIEAALRACAGMRVVDLIRVSDVRRPKIDAAATLSFFPPISDATRAGLIAVAVPGGEWKVASLPANDLVASILAALPRDMNPKLVEPDAKNVARWFATAGSDAMTAAKACVTLVVFGNSVWLRGQVAEEATRTQILDGARNAYPAHLLVHVITLNARCNPVTEALPTARSFPPAPAKDAPGIVAFAVAGEAWKSAPASGEITAPGGIEKAGILPADFPAGVAADEFSEALDALKAHLEQLKKPNQK